MESIMSDMSHIAARPPDSYGHMDPEELLSSHAIEKLALSIKQQAGT